MKRHAALTSTFSNMLDNDGTLSEQSLSKAHRGPLRGVARGVLLAIGIALCFPTEAGSTKPKEYVTYKEFAYHQLGYNLKEYKCLTKLYGKESAWNPKAVGNLNGTHRVYGIPQGKSIYLSTLNGYEQIQWGLDYIGHRYGEPCVAWAHWKAKGWH